MAVVPIESNPDVINKFLTTLGVSDRWRVTDVYSLNDDLLHSVPRPVLSLMLLFPMSKTYEEYRNKENADVEENGQEISSSLYYMKQNLHNACGTVAIIHSIANNLCEIDLHDGCLKQFLTISANLTPEERGKMLKTHNGILEVHKAIANEGQTNPPDANDEVDYHFIAFVCKDGQLYELDGNRPFPIVHGPSSPDTLLEDTAKVVKKFIARDPNNLNFTLLALTPASD